MSERGEHRAIYTVLLQSPEFLKLSPEGQLVWFHLKLMLGSAGIDVVVALEAQLEETTGMPSEGVRDGLADAIGRGFIKRERNIVWMVNGLKFEPSRSLENENHRKSVVKHIAGLPKLAIVNDFADHYGLDPPFPELSPTQSPSDPIPDHGKRRTDNGERRTETENGVEPPPDGVAISEPSNWQSEDVGAWNGGQVLAAYIEYCERRGWPPPPDSQRKKLGAVCKRLATKNSPRQITMAMVGMGNVYPYSSGETWDPFDLDRKFTKAHAAAVSSDDMQEEAFANAFLRRAG